MAKPEKSSAEGADRNCILIPSRRRCTGNRRRVDTTRDFSSPAYTQGHRHAERSRHPRPIALPASCPVFDWGRRYDREALGNDLVAAVIVTIMLIPQSLAYALLAGLPAETGIYASIAPIVLYAIFGTSRALAVGPVAVVSLMTAAAIGTLPNRVRPNC
jgi:hypothetical protein